MIIGENAKVLRIKCSGGAAAQTLALMDALYVSHRTNRGFTFEYYPSGTGTYWPFEIGDLLKSQEKPVEFSKSRGYVGDVKSLEIGKVDLGHPINSKLLSIEKLYVLVRKLKLDRFLLSLRKEIPIRTSKRQLDRVTTKTKTISGGYFPIQSDVVFEDLQRRFTDSGLKSPIAPEKNLRSDFDVVIHYRLGDKRAKYTNPKVVGDDGVICPSVFARQIADLGFSDARILVLSDEPRLAQELLNDAQIQAEICAQKNDIWTDLHLMSRAKIFIGSWSQVSQLASAFVLHNGGKAFLPSEKSGKNSLSWTLDGLVKYEPEFLPENHPIYFK